MQSICTLKRAIFFILFCFTASKISAQSVVACDPPIIVNQPVSVTWDCNGSAVLSTNATGTSVTYQWQGVPAWIPYSWMNLSDGTLFSGTHTSSLNVNTINSNNYGYIYRVIITNACGTDTSESASVSTSPLLLEVSPSNIVVCSQALVPVQITTVVNGSPLLGTWSPATQLYLDAAGTLPYPAGSLANTVYVDPNNFPTLNILCNATNGNCTLTRSIGLYPNTNPHINSHPQDAYTCEGTDNNFTISAGGYVLNYQWQVSPAGCGGTFTDIPGATTSENAVTGITATQDGYAYRCIVSNPCGNKDTSDCAVLHVVTAPPVSVQPEDVYACEGANAHFVSWSYHNDVTTKWQVSTDGGATFTDIPGAIYTYYNVQAAAALNGNQYRAVFSAPNCTGTTASLPATLHVNTAPTIVVQPLPVTVCPYDSAIFIVNTNQTSPIFQWQVSTDGGATFTDLPGASNDTLNLFPVTAQMNNNIYHVVVGGTGCAGYTLSVDVVLSVGSTVAIITSPSDTSVCENNTATFNATASGTALSYQWQLSTDMGVSYTDISGATSTSFVTDPVTASMNNYRYRVIVMGTGSCSTVDTSNAAILTVHIPAPIVIITQPQGATICFGTSYTLTVAATGGTVFYQWEVSPFCGGPWTPLGVSGPIVNTGVITTERAYRCRIWNPCNTGWTYSDCAVITVSGSIDITTQPADQNICPGTDAVFSVVVSTPGTAYQWQVSTDQGTSYSYIPGATNSSVTIPGVTTSMNGYYYRVFLTSSTCSNPVASSAALLTTINPLTVSITPPQFPLCEGNIGVLHSNTSGAVLTYQWQVSTDNGAIYTDIPGATADSLIIGPVTNAMENNLYHVVVTGYCTSLPVVSASASLYIYPMLVFIAQPDDVIVCEGFQANFTISGIIGTNSIQWQVSASGCSGNFVDIPNETSPNLVLPSVSTAMDGYAYRCKARDFCNAADVYSDCAILHVVAGPMIVTQPSNATLCEGQDAVFTVVADSPGYNYQWATSVANNGQYTDIPGATSPTLTVPAVTFSQGNNTYHVLVSNSCNTIVSQVAFLNVYTNPVIYMQPEDTLTCENSTAHFSIITIAGMGGLGITWQLSTDGGISFNNVPGGTQTGSMSGLNLTGITTAMNGYLYQAVLSPQVCPSTTSAIAQLTVIPNPVVTITANPSNTVLLPGQSSVLTASVTAAGTYTYEWQKNQVAISGANSNSITVNSGETGSYNVVVTNAEGCSGISNNITVTADSILGRINVYANPNNGRFNITYPGIETGSRVSIYNSLGNQVYTSATIQPNQVIQIDMGAPPAGIYMIVLYNGAGKRLASGRVMIQH